MKPLNFPRRFSHRHRLLLMVVACQLNACGDSIGALAKTADKARENTEQIAADNRIKDRRRENKILSNADEVHRASPIQVAERYQVREGPDGFMVYDTQTHGLARIQNDVQVGKTLEQAENAVEALNYRDSRAKRGDE